ncbi:hypothetical protein ABC733_27495 [Mangrovibacter sp. SLW1]
MQYIKWHFGEFIFAPHLQLLLRKHANTEYRLRLSTAETAILEQLLAHCGNLCEKETLTAYAWQGRPVSVGVLHIVEADILTGSRWVVSARQLSFMNQIICLVHTRHQLNAGDKQSSLNTYNQQQSGFTVFNYSWRSVSENEIVIFQVSPHHEVLKAKVDGYIEPLG